MKSAIRRLRNQAANTKPPVTLGDGRRYNRGLIYNLGAGRTDRETFLRQYGMSGTLYGIISLLAESSATPPWRLYKKQPVDGRRRYSTADQGSDQRIEVVQHAAIQLWNSPNGWHSGFEFREGSQQHEELTGETFWVLDMEAGFPTSMWYVRPDRMEPVPDPDNYLAGWIYTGPTGEQVPLKTDEVILEKRPDPLDPYRGAGPVASIMPNIQQQRYATEYQRNLFLNGADPGGIITVPNHLDDEEFDQLIDRWRESHRGIARAGHVGVLEDGMTFTGSASSNRDLEYSNLRLTNRDELREAWRIHKAMMGTSDDVNRANAQTAQEVFVAWQVLSRLNRRRDTLNSKFLPLFGSTGKNVEFDYDDPSPVNAETAAQELLSKAQSFQALVAAGCDPHDALETVGLPDMNMAATPPAPQQAPALPPAQSGAFQDRQAITVRAATATTTQPTTPAGPQPPAQLQAVDTQWKAAVALLTTAWLAHIIPGWYASLLAQIRAAVQSGDIDALGALHLDSAQAAQMVLEHTTAYAAAAAKQAADEAAAQGQSGTQPHTPARGDLQAAANAAAALLATQTAVTAGREAARLASGPHPDPDAVTDQVRAFLDDQSDAPVTRTAAAVLSAAQNQARMATITAGPRTQIVATELHDKNTCAACDQINGTVFGYSDDPAAVAAARAAYPAAGYILCEGGAQCRGTVFGLYDTPGGKQNTGGWYTIRSARDAAAKVFEQVAQDYPPSATAWMHHATWSGPAAVPLDHIQPTIKWMDGADPDHVQDFVKRRQQGKKLKPVILVKTPGDPKLLLVDGHHRYLAEAELKEPVRAFIAAVDTDHGPWESMHDHQRGTGGRGDGAPKALATSDMASLLRRVLTDGYTPVEVGSSTWIS